MMNIYTNFVKSCLLIAITIFSAGKSNGQSISFRTLVIASADKDHAKMITVAEPFFKHIAAENNFSIVFTKDTSILNDSSLAHYQVVVQLQLAPFDMSYSQQASLQKFIQQGRGWVGIHAAGLTGKSFLAPGTVYWQWFQDFMGGILYSPHPAFQKGTVIMEDRSHPATKNMPSQFEISDEWYEFDKSPRPDVHVLATADESSYKQNKPMGDHPIIWTNEKFDRMIYIGIGHDSSVCSNAAYSILIRDAILWAASRSASQNKKM